MKKLLTLAGLILLPATIVMAAPEPKVFVCKYIGKPEVDERLQTGQNPINVSQNSIKDYKGVGSYFNDAQGRSYVLAVDIGQPEPNVNECPKTTQNPTTPQTPTTPNTPVTNNTSTGSSTSQPNFTGFQGK